MAAEAPPRRVKIAGIPQTLDVTALRRVLPSMLSGEAVLKLTLEGENPPLVHDPLVAIVSANLIGLVFNLETPILRVKRGARWAPRAPLPYTRYCIG